MHKLDTIVTKIHIYYKFSGYLLFYAIIFFSTNIFFLILSKNNNFINSFLNFSKITNKSILIYFSFSKNFLITFLLS